MLRKSQGDRDRETPESHRQEVGRKTSAHSNKEARDALVGEYTEYVESVVIRLIHSMRLPLSSKEEFISAGFLGLIEAASRFDASRGPEFRAYAYLRIRGSIIDYIRSSCELNGYAYRRLRALEAAQSMREAELDGRRLSQADKLAQAKDSVRYLEKVAVAYAVSTGGNQDAGEVEEQSFVNPEERLQRKQRLEKIRAIVATLPEKERTIIEQHYFGDRKLVEVAEQCAGLSKSWVSRLHDRALDVLREKMLEAIEEIAA